ncbi:MAG: flagellar motor switch protein FliM [Dehalococcoidia bacterium]|nr:MAG: flagellar motor switch protein FliM [Dehalococcoidia bacterium]
MREDRALSQSEIEALLTRIPGGGGSGRLDAPARTIRLEYSRAIKPYDFRRPDKFSKEQWAALQSMHEQFARAVSAALSSRLRTLVHVHLTSIEQGLYEEWQHQVPERTICYVLSMHPLSGNIVVEFGTEVAGEVIDRLLGGTGARLPREREFGEIENGLLRAFSRSITHSLQEMWTQIHPLEPQVQDIGFDPSLVQVAGPTDVVVNVSLGIALGGQTGRMSICLPYAVLEPVADKLSAQLWISSGKNTALTDEERRAMSAVVHRSRLGLVVRLGGADVPAGVLMELQEGDTFVLDQRPGRALDVLVGDRVRFTALPGTSGPNLAVQIAEVVEDNEDVLPESQPAPAAQARAEQPAQISNIAVA